MSSIEWSLINGELGALDASVASQLAEKLLQADFASILKSEHAKAVFTSTPGLFDGLPVDSSSFTHASSSTSHEDATVQLIVGLALVHAFVQANWTGPELGFSPTDLLETTASADDLDSAAVPLLTLLGEPAYHLAQNSSLFLLGSRILQSLPANLVTKPWFLLRAHLIHLSLLDEPVDLDPKVAEELKALESQIPDNQDTLARYHLELGLLQYRLGNDKPANQHFLSAARASGLEFELSGALGKKTKYQVNALSQLVLLAESRQREGDLVEQKGEGGAESDSKDTSVPETLALNDDTLLEETEFTKLTQPSAAEGSKLAHLDPANQPPLHPLDQSLLLSFCLSQHNNSPSSGLTASQMMPFVSRVITHPRNWSVHTTALLLRSRLESNRSRTVERSALQLSALIDQMPTSDSEPQERLRWFHQIPLPSRWEMEKELATRYLSLGVVRSALDIFTRLEMWEDAVSCLQRMEREEEAEKIVRDLLEGRKIESDLVTVLAKSTLTENRKNKLSTAREAKLWCLLGDIALTNTAAAHDPIVAKQKATEYYNKAWEVSGKMSSRSRRSLGSLYFSGREYEPAVECLRDALAINPLYARAWFTLGVCLVRLERWSEAREAFRRQVGVDEDDAEGWNNLAAVYLRLDEEGKSEGEVGLKV
jgi:tetratricopeptide (TPR) repeat protein